MTKIHSIAACAVLPLIMLVAQSGCARHDKAGASGAAEPPQTITVAKARAEKVERQVDVTGTLAPWEDATVSFEVDGRIMEVAVDLGDAVHKDAVLAVVEKEAYEWKKAQADAELSASEADYTRFKELIANNIVSAQKLEDVRRRLEVARAAADLARKALNDTTLRAPFEAAVAKRLVNAGEYVRTGTQAFYLVRLNPLKFEGDVPERYAGDVKVGDQVSAYPESSSQSPVQGSIIRVGPSVTNDSRSFPVEAEIPNPANAIKPGTFARLSIITTTIENALTVPENAVVNFAGSPRAFVIENGKAREQTLEIAGKVKDRVLVAQGLREGDTVALTGVELLSDGQAVSVR